MRGGKSIMRALITVVLLVLFVTPAFGGQAGCVLYTDAAPSSAVAEVTVPDGFACSSGDSSVGETPEYYLLPSDAGSDVRFLYYTTGRGDPQTLAEAALASYSMLYDEFSAGEIHHEETEGLTTLYFDYTCAYPTRTGDALIYEQTAIAYIPLGSDTFIACIASLAFDNSDDYLSTEAMREFLMFAMNAIELSE